MQQMLTSSNIQSNQDVEEEKMSSVRESMFALVDIDK